MTLKRQLLLASLLMLMIPWAGLQFVLELDEALRDQAAEQLGTQARRMASLAETELSSVPPVEHRNDIIYASQLSGPPNLDGYADDWPGYEYDDQPWQTVHGDSTELSWQASVHGRHLYLLIRTNWGRPVYFNPAAPGQPHEFLRLRWQDEGKIRERLVRTAAPGRVVGQVPDTARRQDHRVTGHWESRSDGYQLELRLPRPGFGERLGFEVVWPDPDNPEISHSLGTSQQPPSTLGGRLPELEARLDDLLAVGQRVLVREPAGWVTGHGHRPLADATTDLDDLGPLEILERIVLNGLRALVRLNQPEPAAFDASSEYLADRPGPGLVEHPDGERLLMVTEPLEDGRLLVLEQTLDRILALSGSTLGSVIARSALLIVALMLVLLGYASWLSWRIARLQKAVRASVDPDGRILAGVPASSAKDELGELSRQFSQMVERLQGYTDYLESFSRRLSHELKTPVAVIRSSLDNLDHASSDKERRNYRDRARAATDRLSQILQGMSEAARLEQSFDHAEKETFDLDPVLRETAGAYQALAPEHRIRYQGPDHGAPLTGSPELMVQMLDKLVDNARDFTPEGGLILITLSRQGDQLQLTVFNEGSALPEALARDIFNPFVSIRGGNAEGHLGQGLLIVRLIAEHHGGRVRADNHCSDGLEGARFRIDLPAAP
ncbi:Signal transduction histidine kinase [Marinobacter daqiaonensis]|uniref:histidine kinase n=1 Tax=Marinobacter daqiaonensis TaxID=650891 RepID=A0A1I6JPD2_9GAMM|nr:ATP-binding protein [Marinobacter daqiaonensis]SFR80771.1 Signal transduction histidine kinase [Marinobacter daqiaonensis]